MKVLFLLVLLLVGLPVSESVARPRKEPRTVLDYLDLLPQRFFEVDYPTSRSDRRRWLQAGFDKEIPPENRSIIDIKNDYLRFPGDGAQGRLDLAVFRYQGKATVGVYNDFEEGDLSFWRYKGGHLIEVTSQVLPRNWKKQDFNYFLPRLGTTIRVVKQNFPPLIYPSKRIIIGSLVWTTGRFQLVK